MKIFFNDRPLYLCDQPDPAIEPLLHHDDAVFIDDLNSHTVKTMIHEMEKESVHAGVFLHTDFDELVKAFRKKFTVIRAGGGIIKNKNGELLLIFRKGKWDLPKGKIDKGETMEECALREVREETGLSEIKLREYYDTTFHVYHEGTKHILKESHWYLMDSVMDEELVPQTEEGIEVVKWMDPGHIKEVLHEAFPSVRDVLVSYLPIRQSG